MTLVEMFRKAEAEGCKNLDGSCSNEEHLHIGDYVDYKNPTSGAYTVTAEKSGISENQTYDVAKNQLNWRVLGIDETTGELKLIAGSPMKINKVAENDLTDKTKWEMIADVPWDESGVLQYSLTSQQLEREPWRVMVLHETPH